MKLPANCKYTLLFSACLLQSFNVNIYLNKYDLYDFYNTNLIYN